MQMIKTFIVIRQLVRPNNEFKIPESYQAKVYLNIK